MGCFVKKRLKAGERAVAVYAVPVGHHQAPFGSSVDVDHEADFLPHLFGGAPRNDLLHIEAGPNADVCTELLGNFLLLHRIFLDRVQNIYADIN